MSKKTKKPEAKLENLKAPDIGWHTALKIIRNRVFKIRSPRGHGTGFHIGNFGINDKLCAIATAFHVIESEIDWDEPIKLIHEATGKEILLKSNDRAIFPFPKSDLAIILFTRTEDLQVPSAEIEYFKADKPLFGGVDVGWCGFPSVASEKLCFFHGYISCNLPDSGYLVDGVAINGVSGGPVFFIDDTVNRPIVVGVISAYIPNRNSRDALPGVSMVSSIPEEYESRIIYLRNLPKATEEAKKQVKASKAENFKKNREKI